MYLILGWDRNVNAGVKGFYLSAQSQVPANVQIGRLSSLPSLPSSVSFLLATILKHLVPIPKKVVLEESRRFITQRVSSSDHERSRTLSDTEKVAWCVLLMREACTSNVGSNLYCV